MKFDDITIEGSAEIKRKLFLGEFDPLFSGKCKIDGDLVVNGRIINNEYIDNTSIQHKFAKLIIGELEGEGEIKINSPITVPIIYPRKIFLGDTLIENRNNKIEINEKLHCPSIHTEEIRLNKLIGNEIGVKSITTQSLLSGDIQSLNINVEKLNCDNATFKALKTRQITLPDEVFISHLTCNTLNGIKLPVDEILTVDKKQPLNNKFLSNPFDANNNRIINLGEPTMPNDCATKSYVDKYLGSFKIYQSVAVLLSKTDELKGEVLDSGGIITIKFAENIKIDGIPLTTIVEGDRIMVLDKLVFKNGVIYPEIYTVIKYKRLTNSHNYVLILECDDLLTKIKEKYVGIKVLNGKFYADHTIIYHRESKVITWI